jgi:hypothetical protein
VPAFKVKTLENLLCLREGQFWKPNISGSVQILFKVYILIRKDFLSAFQWCVWKFYQFCSFLTRRQNVEKHLEKYLKPNFRGPAKSSARLCRGGISWILSVKWKKIQVRPTFIFDFLRIEHLTQVWDFSSSVDSGAPVDHYNVLKLYICVENLLIGLNVLSISDLAILTRLSQLLWALGSYIGVPRFVLAGIANGKQEFDSPDNNGLLLVELDVLPCAKSSPPLNCEQRSRARELVMATYAHSEYQPILPCNEDHLYYHGWFLGKVYKNSFATETKS